MHTLIRLVLTAVLLAAPIAAHAQLQVSPFAGVNFGGDTTSTSGTVGLSATYWVTPWMGIEAEAAISPTFFEQDGFLIDRSVATYTSHVLFAPTRIRAARLQPFVLAGLGALRPNLAEAGGLVEVKGQTLGLSVGVGAMGMMNDHVGFRADLRYLRGLRASDLDANAFGVDFSTLAFWRTTGGFVVRF